MVNPFKSNLRNYETCFNLTIHPRCIKKSNAMQVNLFIFFLLLSLRGEWPIGVCCITARGGEGEGGEVGQTTEHHR